uniref:CCHC-type domain-containing protein n=1 Tax=Chenopodium quinoa TaxID=63459 RepID=A0A803NCW4_CHEQI
MKEDEWKVLDKQALGVIRLTLAKSVAYNVKDVTTTIGVIKALSNMYEKPSAMNKVFLMRRLFEIEMNDSGSAPEYINEFNSIIPQLASVEIKFDDEVRSLILLSSLPRSWDTVVASISNTFGKSKFKCDDVRDLILSESLRRKNSGESSGGAYSSEGRGRGRQQRGAQRGRWKSRGRSKSKGKVNIVCWGCGVKGHTKRECPNPKKKGGLNHKNHDDASLSVSLASSDEIDDALILSVDSPIESWILDLGASFHYSPCMEIFQNFKSDKFEKVYHANDEPLDIVGKGDVMIKTSSGSSWKLEDVSSLYKDNFGGKSIEKESIGDEWEFVELDDDDDHLETDERVVMGEPVVVQGEPSTPPTLKKIKLLNVKGNANDVKLLEYILSKAIVLERLYVSSACDGYGDDDRERDQLWRQYKLSKTLLLVPRSTEVEFVGGYIHLSNNRCISKWMHCVKTLSDIRILAIPTPRRCMTHQIRPYHVTPRKQFQNLRKLVVCAKEQKNGDENEISKEPKPNNENGTEASDDQQTPLFKLRWTDLLLDPDPDNVLAVGLTGLLTWASVQVVWQLLAVSLAIVELSSRKLQESRLLLSTVHSEKSSLLDQMLQSHRF